MRILITGRDGQVGGDLLTALAGDAEIVAFGRDGLDLARPQAIESVLDEINPDLVVNAGAYTAVDRAESEPELALAVNGLAPGLIAAWAERAGAALVHFSTDYVFDGTKDGAYVEDDAPAPLSVYGRTKLAGEAAIAASGAAHLILRTSWVYAPTGRNFVNTMLRLARERTTLSIVDDQIGAPTWSRCLADAVATIVSRAGTDRAAVRQALGQRGGIFHLTCADATSWCGFARRIFELVPDGSRVLRDIVPIATAQYPTPARRPLNSRLSNRKIAEHWGIQLPSWESALHTALAHPA